MRQSMNRLVRVYGARLWRHSSVRAASRRDDFIKYELDNPHLWFPKTREYGQRLFILHCGPTNSGKTYTALRHLATASRGLYAGPLRILCNEVKEKLDSNYQVLCNLITGNEKIMVEDATHTR